MVVEPTRIQLYVGQHERQRSLEETDLAVCGVPRFVHVCVSTICSIFQTCGLALKTLHKRNLE